MGVSIATGVALGQWTLDLYGCCVCRGKCSFWSTWKIEFYDRKKWLTRNQARKAVA